MDRSLYYPLRKFGVAAVLLILGSSLIYWALGAGVYLQQGFSWDEPVMLAVHSLSQPWLDSLFLFVTETAAILVIFPVAAMFLYLWRRQEKITAVLVVLTAAIFPLISLLLKNEFGRPRQNIFPPLVVETTASFPSGHTLTAVGVYGLAAVLLWQRGHRVLALLCGAWVLLVALSRVYLGAHYPSDVLASLALGTIMVILVVYIDNGLKVRMHEKSGQLD